MGCQYLSHCLGRIAALKMVRDMFSTVGCYAFRYRDDKNSTNEDSASVRLLHRRPGSLALPGLFLYPSVSSGPGDRSYGTDEVIDVLLSGVP